LELAHFKLDVGNVECLDVLKVNRDLGKRFNPSDSTKRLSHSDKKISVRVAPGTVGDTGGDNNCCPLEIGNQPWFFGFGK
jgi:hypothetical protein